MPAKTKEQLAADLIAEHTQTKTAPKASAAQREQARKARAGARIAKANKSAGSTSSTARSTNNASSSKPTSSLTTANRSDLAGYGGVDFRASNYMTGDIWVPDSRIPAIDEATFEKHKTTAEGQSRSIEVASLNLKNIQGLHKLEGQTVDIAIAAKGNETRYAKLEGAEIGYQTQVQMNGQASQQLLQATAKHEAATRETGYTNQLIGLKDKNFQHEIEQAQMMLDQKIARFTAQLSGQ